MKTKERMEITSTNKEKFGTSSKKIRWKIICVETKEHPRKPKAMITGEVLTIYPTGDIAFKRILKIELWNLLKDKVSEINIPKCYKQAKKIVIRREIIATLLYLEELEEEVEKND